MNIITTTAPIAIDELKKYFADKTISYVIDYDNSSLKGTKLLTYLGNLDLPCDIRLDFTKDEHFELLKDYLETNFLVKILSLELAVIDCLLTSRGLEQSEVFSEFIKNNSELLNQWETRLDSLTLYNLWILNNDELRAWVENHPEDTSDTAKYINFVNLLKHTDFYQFYSSVKQENLKNYKHLFSDYCFKGKNLYEYWAVDTNPLFLLTWSIAEGQINTEEYIRASKQDLDILDS